MTLADKTSLNDLKKLQEQLVARLSAFRASVRRRLVLEGVAIVAVEIVAAGLLTFVLDHALRLGVLARVVMILACLAAIGWEIYRRVIEPMRMRMGLIALAGAVGKKSAGRRELAALVASVLELPRLLESKDPPGAAMVERAVVRCHDALSSVNFDTTLDPSRLKKTYAALAAAILLPLILMTLFHSTAGLWARRMFALSTEPWPQNTYLEVADLEANRIAVPRGEPYVVKVHARPGSVVPDRVTLTLRTSEKTVSLMKEFGKNDFRHDIAVVDQPFTLEISGGDDDVGPITVQPVDRPRIAGLELISQHPLDKTPQKHQFGGGDSDLNFLVKTKLSLVVSSNVPLRELRLKPNSPLPTPQDVRRIDATHFAVEWVHAAPARFEVELVAADTGLISIPAAMSIGLKVNQPPRIAMTYTGVHPHITPAAKIPLTLDARDDFGIKTLSLALKDESPDPADPATLIPHEISVPLFPAQAATETATQAATQPALETELQLKHTVNVAAMKLQPGAIVSITAAAADDCYTGSQTGHSRTVSFRLVPAEELFREILLRQQSERMKFRKEVEEAEKIRDALQSPTALKDAADLARRHRALQREVQRIATVLTESLAEIKLNSLGSPESHALMEHNVLAPLASLSADLLAPQTEGLDALSLPQNQSDPALLAAVAARQAQVAARMNVILKQMAQWDSFVNVLNQLDEIIKLETQVKDQSEKMRKKETDDIFDK